MPNGNVHPTAIIEDGARVGSDVRIGPYCMVGRDVVLGDGVELLSHVVVAGRTDDRRAHAHLSVRLDRPSAAGPQVQGRAVDAGGRQRLPDPRGRDHEPRHRGRRHADGGRRPLRVPRQLACRPRLPRRRQRHLLQQRHDCRPCHGRRLRHHRRRRRRDPVRASGSAFLHRRHVGHGERPDPLRHGGRQPRAPVRAQHRRPAAARLFARRHPQPAQGLPRCCSPTRAR